MKKKANRKNKKVDPQRFEYSANDQLIEKAILDHLKEEKTIPTQTQIAKRTGLVRETVCRHMKNMTFSNFLPTYKSMTPSVVNALFVKCRSGNPQAIRLWGAWVEGFKDVIKTENDHTIHSKDVDDDHALEILEAATDSLRSKSRDA